jgi:hypothetical protein
VEAWGLSPRNENFSKWPSGPGLLFIQNNTLIILSRARSAPSKDLVLAPVVRQP